MSPEQSGGAWEQLLRDLRGARCEVEPASVELWLADFSRSRARTAFARSSRVDLRSIAAPAATGSVSTAAVPGVGLCGARIRHSTAGARTIDQRVLVKLGFSLASMIGIRVSGDRLLAVAQEISAFDEVIYLILCTGSFDMLAEVVCRDNDHLLTFLTEKLYKVQGVQQAETYMYLRVCKDTGTLVRLFPPFPKMVNLGE